MVQQGSQALIYFRVIQTEMPSYQFALSDTVQVVFNAHILAQILPVREVSLVTEVILKLLGDVAVWSTSTACIWHRETRGGWGWALLGDAAIWGTSTACIWHRRESMSVLLYAILSSAKSEILRMLFFVDLEYAAFLFLVLVLAQHREC